MQNVDAASDYEVADDSRIDGNGVRDWLGRAFYEGQWKNSEYHGTGHLIETNGDEYTGEFRDGRRHGWGKVIQSTTGDIYEGTWEDSKMHGKGKLVEKVSQVPAWARTLHSVGSTHRYCADCGRSHKHLLILSLLVDRQCIRRQFQRGKKAWRVCPSRHCHRGGQKHMPDLLRQPHHYSILRLWPRNCLS